MAEEKKMNEEQFAQVVQEMGAVGELIRTHQEEKQAAMDEFDKEIGRFKSGKISDIELASSIRKVNRELSILDRAIRADIKRLGSIAAKRAKAFGARQAPKSFRATTSGIS